MKKLIFSTGITALTILIFAFGDSSQNSFSQQAKRSVPLTVMPPQTEAKSTAVKKQELILESLKDSLRMTRDSVRLEFTKTDSIKVESEVNLDNQLVNKNKLQNLHKEAKKTLIVAQQNIERTPMIFVTPTRKVIAEIPVTIKPKDSIPDIIEKRTLWDKIFHPKKKRK